MIREHKMLFYLTLYKGLIQKIRFTLSRSILAYLTLYKGLIPVCYEVSAHFHVLPTLPYIRG